MPKLKETEAVITADTVKETTKKEKASAKTTKRKAAVKTKVDFYVEFNGKQVLINDIIDEMKALYGKEAKEITVYLKPEDNKAYFVVDGEEKELDVCFS